VLPKVAIVGNAPYTLPLGEYIDSCDEVIRFNLFKTQGHEKYVGSKTTIWCLFPDCIKICDPPACEQIWTWGGRHFVKTPEFALVQQYAKQNQKKFVAINDRTINYIKTQVGTYPSTGVLAVKAAIDRFGPVFVTGITGFQSREHHYFSVEDMNADATKLHDGIAELRFIRKLQIMGFIYPCLPKLL